MELATTHEEVKTDRKEDFVCYVHTEARAIDLQNY
jgi:hypothetical protein